MISLIQVKSEGGDNELEFLFLKNAIFRNKKLIFYFTLAGIFFGFLSGLQKNTWQGEFEIVVEDQKNDIASRFGSILSGSNSQLLGSLVGNRSASKSIKTEIGDF